MARDIPFSELTTLQVGGPADEARHRDDPARPRRPRPSRRGTRGEPWLALGGGSNLLVGDEGFDGTVIRVATKGIEVLGRGDGDGAGAARRTAPTAMAPAARHPFACACRPARRGTTSSRGRSSTGYSGFEALSGIPGSVGAAPVQNIGAYGQELEATLVAIEFLDEGAEAPRRMARGRARARLSHLGAEARACAASWSRSSSSCTTPRSSAPCSARRSGSRSPTRSSPTRCT